MTLDSTHPAALNQAAQRWHDATYAPAVKQSAERAPRFFSTSGHEIQPCYAPQHLDEQGQREWLNKLGFPGEFPFTRGIHPTMYRSRHWTMRQYAGFGTAAATNQRYKFLLNSGQTGLSVAFDLPTQIGYDSDAPMADGEVGKTGVAICTLDDMLTLFDGIPLDKVSTSMTINSTAGILLALYVAVGERQGVGLEKLRGTVQNDLLKEFIARKTFIYPPGPSLRIITDIIAFCAQKMPRFNPISISGYHIREAGSTAAQEIGFTLANGIAYVEAARNAGLSVDAFAPQLSFFFNAHNNFLEEVAKFRAARRIWAKLMRDRFGAKNPEAWKLRFHTQTAGSTLTSQQPDNNIIRVTLQALAAVLGGTQSLHTNSRDEALALPTEHAVNIALRTQQIIAYESGVCDTVDPLGGSVYIEALTDDLERRAFDYIKKVDELGGSVAAIERGYFQREIQTAAYEYQRQVETGFAVVVGVNKFAQAESKPPEALLRVDETAQREQIARIKAFKQKRDSVKVAAALSKLQADAKGNANLMESMLACVRDLCTLGEISDALRKVFGEYREAG